MACICLFVYLFPFRKYLTVYLKTLFAAIYSLQVLREETNGYVKSYEPCAPMNAELSSPGRDASPSRVTSQYFFPVSLLVSCILVERSTVNNTNDSARARTRTFRYRVQHANCNRTPVP